MVVNSQLVYLPLDGIFNPNMFIWKVTFFQLKWHAWELSTTINIKSRTYNTIHSAHHLAQYEQI